MIVDALDVRWALRRPDEAQAKLIVHPYRVLPGAIPDQRFESISRRASEIAEGDGGIEHGELPLQDRSYVRETPARATMEDGLGVRAPERHDGHIVNIPVADYTSSVQDWLAPRGSGGTRRCRGLLT